MSLLIKISIEIKMCFSFVRNLADDSTTSSQQQQQLNGLTRSRRSHFSRKDSTPEGCAAAAVATSGTSSSSLGGAGKDSAAASIVRIVHEYERLMYYAKSPHSWALPSNWLHICDKFPGIIRNKVNTIGPNNVHDNANNY